MLFSRFFGISRIYVVPWVCLAVAASARDRMADEQVGARHGRVRIHFIAAEEIEWDYGPAGRDEAMGHAFSDFEKGHMEPGPHRIGRVYKKCVYREYTDAKFNRLVERSGDQQYLGILGPILYAEVGDTLKVVFKNRASRPYSMHPHGVLYNKNSEGSMTNDGTTGGTTFLSRVPEDGRDTVPMKHPKSRELSLEPRVWSQPALSYLGAKTLPLGLSCGRISKLRSLLAMLSLLA